MHPSEVLNLDAGHARLRTPRKLQQQQLAEAIRGGKFHTCCVQSLGAIVAAEERSSNARRDVKKPP
jgi:hypothetical protein